MARAKRNADHAGPDNAAMKEKAILQNIQNSSLRMIVRLDALDSLMVVRVEGLARSHDALESMARQRVPKLAINQFQTFTIFLVSRIVVRLERPLECIQNRQKVFDQSAHSMAPIFLALALHALAVILKVRLPAHQGLHQFVLFGLQAGGSLGERGRLASFGRLGTRPWIGRFFARPGARLEFNHALIGLFLLMFALVHMLPKPLS